MTQPETHILDSTILTRANNTLVAQVGADTVMMAPERGVYYGLNPVGSDVWARLEQPLSLGQLISDLTASYRGDAAQIRQDVLALVAQLHENGLVTFS